MSKTMAAWPGWKRRSCWSRRRRIFPNRCAPRLDDWKAAVKKGVITQAQGEKLAAAHEAVSKVIEVDDFAAEALSPIYRKAADVHQFFQELGEQRAAS